MLVPSPKYATSNDLSNSALTIFALLSAFFLFLFVLAEDYGREVLAYAMVASSVALIPVRNIDGGGLYSPYFMVFIMLCFCGVMKVGYVVTTPLQEHTSTKLLLDANLQSLYPGLFLLLLFVTFYVLVAAFVHPVLKPILLSKIKWVEGRIRLREVNERFVVLAVLVVTTVSFFSFLKFLDIQGIDILKASLSGKRFLSVDGGMQNRLASNSYIYFKLAFMVKAAFYFLLYLALEKKRQIYFFSLILIAVYVVFLAVFFSSRVELLLLATDFSLLFFILTARKMLPFLFFVISILLIYIAISLLRGEASIHGDPVYSLVGLRYLSGVPKISALHNYFSTHPELYSGETLFGWVGVAFSQFKDGLEAYMDLPFRIGSNIYLEEVSGVPPGGIAEAYINFGYMGVALTALVFGFIVVFCSIVIASVKSSLLLIVFFLFSVRFVFFFFNSFFATGFLKSVTDLSPFIIGILFIILFSRHNQADGFDGIRTEK